MVVRLDALEFDVDKVLGVERASQDLVWLDLLCFALEAVLVKSPTRQKTAGGHKVSSCTRLFGRRCFRRVESALQSLDEYWKIVNGEATYCCAG